MYILKRLIFVLFLIVTSFLNVVARHVRALSLSTLPNADHHSNTRTHTLSCSLDSAAIAGDPSSRHDRIPTVHSLGTKCIERGGSPVSQAKTPYKTFMSDSGPSPEALILRYISDKLEGPPALTVRAAGTPPLVRNFTKCQREEH